MFAENIDELLEKTDFSHLGKKVGLKVHFGEKGCTTYLSPNIVKKVYDKIKNTGREVELIECNVLYKGDRTTTTDHLRTAKKHGFGFAPINILDGEHGQEVLETNGCKIGAGIKKYDSLVVLTHFKGHMITGIGGAIKNVGMGLGSRAGKLAMHSDVKPNINQSRCTSCGTCVKNCPVNAIIIEKKARINPDTCIGCAMCIEVCPVKAVRIPWSGSTNKEVQEKICKYAKTVLSLFGKKVLFINALVNITSNCDCMHYKQEIITKDIGYVSSKNIVEVEKESKKLLDEKGILKNNSEKFQHMISYAEKIGLGKKN